MCAYIDCVGKVIRVVNPRTHQLVYGCGWVVGPMIDPNALGHGSVLLTSMATGATEVIKWPTLKRRLSVGAMAVDVLACPVLARRVAA